MNKEYVIYFKEEPQSMDVYLVPKDVKIREKSLFSIKVGYIALRKEPNVFRILDSDRMTMGVMESILRHWKQCQWDRD